MNTVNYTPLESSVSRMIDKGMGSLSIVHTLAKKGYSIKETWQVYKSVMLDKKSDALKYLRGKCTIQR